MFSYSIYAVSTLPYYIIPHFRIYAFTYLYLDYSCNSKGILSGFLWDFELGMATQLYVSHYSHYQHLISSNIYVTKLLKNKTKQNNNRLIA